MAREQVELSFIGAGWEIANRSSRHLLLGRFGNLSVWARGLLSRTNNPVFELLDGEQRHRKGSA